MSRRQRVTELFRLATSMARLGADPVASTWAFAVVLALPLKRRFSRAHKAVLTLHLEKFGHRFSFAIRQRCDVLVVREVLGLEAYAVPGIASPEVIVDLGSNIGASVVYFHLRYPDARIHAFEPDPAAFALLERNTRGLPGVTLHQVAVSDSDGDLKLFAAEESFASSLMTGQDGDGTTVVRGRRLDTIVRELSLDRIDLLKIDIEGAEFGAIAAFDGLDRVGTIVGEVHADLMGKSADDFLALLGGFDLESEREHMPALPDAERYSLVARQQPVGVV